MNEEKCMNFHSEFTTSIVPIKDRDNSIFLSITKAPFQKYPKFHILYGSEDTIYDSESIISEDIKNLEIILSNHNKKLEELEDIKWNDPAAYPKGGEPDEVEL